MSMEDLEVVVYGRDLCADTTRARAFLEARAIRYRYLDVAVDPAARELARELASGSSSIPVVVLTDGSVLVEPSDDDLVAALRRDG